MSLENSPSFLLNFSGCEMSGEAKQFYRFKSFRLSILERQLLHESTPVALTPKAFEVLAVLVERSGHLVEKEELLKLVWGDAFVEEANVTRIVHTLRKVLGEDDNGNKFIETVAKKGYRFVAEVTEVGEAAAPDSATDKPEAFKVVEPLSADNSQPLLTKAEQTFPQQAAKPKLKTRLLLFAGGGFSAVLLLGWLAFYLPSKPKMSASDVSVKSIAVLPFKPLSADGRDKGLELGMADTLINKLSGIKRLAVRPLGAIRRYVAIEYDSVAAGKDLGVDYVLEGSLQMIGEQTRVNVQLLSVKDGTAVWTDSCDKQCSTIFELQDAIAARIATSLAIKLSGEDRVRLAKHSTENPDAYRAYLLGRYFHDKRTPETTEQSIEYFEQAVKLDPHYARAYATLADAHISLAKMSVSLLDDVMPQAKAAAEKALEIDDTLAEAHASLGSIKFFEWDWAGAEREFKRAIEINPNHEHHHTDYEFYLINMKRFDEAVAESKRVLELDPVSVVYNRNVAVMLYFARRYDEAIEQCQKTLKLDPNMKTVFNWLSRAYEQKKEYDQAVEAYLKFWEFEGETVAAYREIYATSGWKEFWRKRLDLLKVRAKPRGFHLVGMAENYARLGEKDQAFACLEKAFDQREVAITIQNPDPFWDSYHSDPRFIDIIRRMGIEP